jgi:hypothetical protein
MASFNFSIDLPVRSEWKNVDLLRTSVQNCFVAIFSDLDGCHAISMVTGELIENAIKYGHWDGEAQSFRLRVSGGAGRATITVENPIKVGDAGVADLLRTIAWLQDFPTAAEAYRARLMEIAAAPADSGGSRLGLVRVAYEGGCKLYAEPVGNMLAVSAAMEF